MGLYTALYFLGCDNMKMSGVTLPYYNSSSLLETTASPFQVNLTADCNRGCDCSPNYLEPICGRNGITYFSPCHAGCSQVGGPRHIQNYNNCACIADRHQEVTAIPIATAGPCPQTCKAMVPFLIILFIVTLVVSITQVSERQHAHLVESTHSSGETITNFVFCVPHFRTHKDAVIDGDAAIGERRGARVRSWHAVCHIPFVWLHPVSDNLRKRNRLDVHAVESKCT